MKETIHESHEVPEIKNHKVLSEVIETVKSRWRADARL